MDVQKIIEALIFAADSPLKPAQLLEIFQNEDFFGMPMDETILTESLAGLVAKYEDETYVFELKQIDGGYQFYTKKEFYPFVKHAVLAKSTRRMSRATLETLSIIAYKQPITKTEIEFIRGVNCDYAVSKLLEKNLIEIRGRADVAGRPLIYGTTPFFMEYFALNDLKDLPKLDELHSEEKEFQAQFKVYINDEEGDNDDTWEGVDDLGQLTISEEEEGEDDRVTEDLNGVRQLAVDEGDEPETNHNQPHRSFGGEFTITDSEEE
jgi:segregation and condensation protein B